jgi:predicted small integral membrane protein
MTTIRWPAIYGTTGAVMLAALGFLVWATPRNADGIAWLDPMIKGGWMAWTFPVALFFYTIACLLVTFTLLAIRYPETPRIGVLHIETTRGDRLFISLLGSAFLCLAWLALIGTSLWSALIVCLIFAAAVFRWV